MNRKIMFLVVVALAIFAVFSTDEVLANDTTPDKSPVLVTLSANSPYGTVVPSRSQELLRFNISPPQDQDACLYMMDMEVEKSEDVEIYNLYLHLWDASGRKMYAMDWSGRNDDTGSFGNSSGHKCMELLPGGYPQTLKIVGDIEGRGTLSVAITRVYALDPDNGNDLPIEGLPIQGNTLSVAQQKVFSYDFEIDVSPVVVEIINPPGESVLPGKNINLYLRTRNTSPIPQTIAYNLSLDHLAFELERPAAIDLDGSGPAPWKTYEWGSAVTISEGWQNLLVVIPVPDDFLAPVYVSEIAGNIQVVRWLEGTALPVPVLETATVINVPEDCGTQEAFMRALPGTTIVFAPGSYWLTGKDGAPVLPGGVTVQGAGRDKTFLFGMIESAAGKITAQNLTVVNLEGPAISAGKEVALENVTVLANGGAAVSAGWKDVVLKIRNSTIVNVNFAAVSIGIEVRGSFNAASSWMTGNTFVNHDCGISVPTTEFEEFKEKALKDNSFYGVAPVCRAAFG